MATRKRTKEYDLRDLVDNFGSVEHVSLFLVVRLIGKICEIYAFTIRRVNVHLENFPAVNVLIHSRVDCLRLICLIVYR